MEKCYRDIQDRGQIAGLNIPELFILIGVPLLLFPLFTLLNWNSLIILVIELALFAVFRLAGRLSTFDYGLISLIMAKFVWPEKLSAFKLDEQHYLKEE